MQARSPSKGQEYEITRVKAFLEERQTDRGAQASIGEPQDTLRSLFGGEAQRSCDSSLNGRRCALRVERHSPSEEVAAVEATEDEIGVRHGGLRPAAAISDRAGRGPGASRP